MSRKKMFLAGHCFSDIYKGKKYKALILKYMPCILKYMPYVFCKMPCVFFGVRIAHHRLTYFVATVYGKIKIKWYYCITITKFGGNMPQKF